VVLATWLTGRGASTLGSLQVICGLSYPTVAAALAELEARGELRRNRDRSVEFNAFPRHTWEQVAALSDQLRRPMRFVDPSGRTPDPAFLLRRTEKASPPGVALGGVVAARHWHPDFDLHGIPRLDLCLDPHAGTPAEEIVRGIDRSLRPAWASSGETALVLHPVLRARPLFARPPGPGLPIADPVESLLDLHELHLHAQGWAMVKHLESRRADVAVR
jgi:hypothetical protein